MSTEDGDSSQSTSILDHPVNSDDVVSVRENSETQLNANHTLYPSSYTGQTGLSDYSRSPYTDHTNYNVLPESQTYTDHANSIVVQGSQTYINHTSSDDFSDSELFPEENSQVLPESRNVIDDDTLDSNNDRVDNREVVTNDDSNDHPSNITNDRLETIPDGVSSNREQNDNEAVVDLEQNYNDTAIINNDEVSTDDRSTQNEDGSSSGSNLDSVRSRKRDLPPDCPPAKVRKVELEETDGETCPICLDSWSSSGDHRIVALKCGHLFGASCVERWLRAQPLKTRSCPTCKSKATLKDMRYIYAKRVIVQDTSQITELQQQVTSLQSELQKKSRVELELEKLKIAFRASQLEREVLRSTLMKNQFVKEPVRRQWRFSLEKNLQICREGGCRVLTYNCRTYELYVSQKSTNNLFPGYGIRKISCVDYKLGQFVHLHPKPIRDITYSQPRDLLLSVGLDSTARIVERGIPSITINAGMPLWSCSWDYLRSNEFYVGGVGGVVNQYDFRNPSTYLQTIRNMTDISPVASLCSTEYGLLSCQLNSSWLWVGNQRQWEPRSLPVDGPFTSLCYDNESHRALVCTRPNVLEKAKLKLCRLKSGIHGEVMVDLEETFNGTARSSLMSRATWVKAPGASWIASHSESDSALFLHGVDGANTMMLHAAEPAIDVCSLQLNGNTLLAALSESRLRIYKAVASS